MFKSDIHWWTTHSWLLTQIGILNLWCILKLWIRNSHINILVTKHYYLGHMDWKPTFLDISFAFGAAFHVVSEFWINTFLWLLMVPAKSSATPVQICLYIFKIMLKTYIITLEVLWLCKITIPWSGTIKPRWILKLWIMTGMLSGLRPRVLAKVCHAMRMCAAAGKKVCSLMLWSRR